MPWRLTILLLLLTGCEDRLETGYKFRKLSSTDDDRRAYYASPFSPEAAQSDEGGQPLLDHSFHR